MPDDAQRSPTPPSQAETGATPASAEAPPTTRNRAASTHGAAAMLLLAGIGMIVIGAVAGTDDAGLATILCGVGALGIGAIAAARIFPPRTVGLFALGAGVAIAASALLADSFSTATWGRLLGGAFLFMAGAGLAATSDRGVDGDREPQTRFRS